MSVRYTARQIYRFLIADIEKTQRGSPRYDSEYKQRERGGSRPPLTNEGLRWIDEGLSFCDESRMELPREEATRCAARLNIILRDLDREPIPESVAPGGHTLHGILALMRSEPGFVRWVENGESKNAKSYRDALAAVCMIVATEFRAAYPRVEMVVRVAPDQELARPKTPEAYHEERRVTKEDSYRRIAAKVEEMKAEGMGSAEAVAAYVEEAKSRGAECSRSRVYEALKFTEDEAS